MWAAPTRGQRSQIEYKRKKGRRQLNTRIYLCVLWLQIQCDKCFYQPTIMLSLWKWFEFSEPCAQISLYCRKLLLVDCLVIETRKVTSALRLPSSLRSHFYCHKSWGDCMKVQHHSQSGEIRLNMSFIYTKN